VSETTESNPEPSQPARSARASWTVCCRAAQMSALKFQDPRFLLKPVIDNEGGLAQSRCCRTTGGASERSWSLSESVLSALIVVASYPSQRYTKFVFCLKKNNKQHDHHLCSMQRPRSLLPGLLPRAVRPQQLALPQLREKSCDTPASVLHSTIMSCTSARCMSASCTQSACAMRTDSVPRTRAQPR
jgi:hypothetical protein